MAEVPAQITAGRRRAALPILGLVVAALSLPPSAASAAPADGPLLSYLVNTSANGRAVDRAEQAVRHSGGTIVHSYSRIGVVVARSANPNFAGQLRRIPGIQSAGATRTAPLSPTDSDDPVPLRRLSAASAGKAETKAPSATADPLEPLQWDLPAIKADQAHLKSLGSRRVLVGVIDTGVDDTHPDLRANFDEAASVSCVGGKPDTRPGAWRPYTGAAGSYHGTHVAGTIAAARNGIGITGVAPGVRIAGIKVSDPGNSLFYPESVVCGFVWAADHGVDVTNNSYYVDPWYFNCITDPDQRAIVDAVGRAVRYAERRGTLNVAAAGNSNFDLAATTIADTTSPDDGRPVNRIVELARCPDLPVRLPNVVAVSATGAQDVKSSYSNYGRNVIDVTAPGGDSYQSPAPPAVSGGILSTLPGNEYGYLAGTSMANPHVVGVAALLKSTHPWATPEMMRWLLNVQADPIACPDRYDIDQNGTIDAVCAGSPGYNGFYGNGIVDALDAVRR